MNTDKYILYHYVATTNNIPVKAKKHFLAYPALKRKRKCKPMCRRRVTINSQVSKS